MQKELIFFIVPFWEQRFFRRHGNARWRTNYEDEDQREWENGYRTLESSSCFQTGRRPWYEL